MEGLGGRFLIVWSFLYTEDRDGERLLYECKSYEWTVGVYIPTTTTSIHSLEVDQIQVSIQGAPRAKK